MAQESKKLEEVLLEIASDSDLPAEKKRGLIDLVRSLGPSRLDDPLLYRTVVIILGLVALATLAGGIASHLTAQEKDFPSALIAIGSTALGALAGLLAPFSKT
jgi:hypothetical protein